MAEWHWNFTNRSTGWWVVAGVACARNDRIITVRHIRKTPRTRSHGGHDARPSGGSAPSGYDGSGAVWDFGCAAPPPRRGAPRARGHSKLTNDCEAFTSTLEFGLSSHATLIKNNEGPWGKSLFVVFMEEKNIVKKKRRSMRGESQMAST